MAPLTGLNVKSPICRSGEAKLVRSGTRIAVLYETSFPLTEYRMPVVLWNRVLGSHSSMAGVLASSQGAG
jgi:hypothetical protein